MAWATVITDDEAVRLIPEYAPIQKPIPIPPTQPFEEPTVCIQINKQWVPHLLGVIDALDQLDAWEGTEEEVFDARMAVREIEEALTTGNACPMAIIDIRVNGCLLEVKYIFEPETWVTIGDMSACTPAGTVTSLRDDDCQLQVEIDGEWEDVPNANYFRTTAECDITGNTRIARDGVSGVIGSLDLLTLSAIAPGSISAGFGTAVLHRANRQGESTLRNIARSRGYWLVATTNPPLSAYIVELWNGTIWQPILSMNLVEYAANITVPSGVPGGLNIVPAGTVTNPILNIKGNASGHDALKVFGTGETRIEYKATLNNIRFPVLRLTNRHSAAASIFGDILYFDASDSVGTPQTQLALMSWWSDPTSATRKAEIALQAFDNVGARTIVHGAADGVEARIGFMDNTPIPKQMLPDLAAETPAVQYIARKLRDFGLFRESPIVPPPDLYDWNVCYPFDFNPYWTLWDYVPGTGGVQSHGTWTIGTGWVSDDRGGVTSNVAIGLYKDFSADATVNYINAKWSISGMTSGAIVTVVMSYKDGAIYTDFYQESFTANGDYGFTSITERAGIDGYRIFLTANAVTPDPTIVLTSIEIRGKLTEPTNSDGEDCP